MTSTTMETSDRTAATTRIALPAALLGIGFGGLVDVVAFRQVLQWHHLLSNAGDDRLGLDPQPAGTVSGLAENMRWDGWFSAAALLLSLMGLVMLVAEVSRDRRPSVDQLKFWGWFLVGAGAYVVLEGLIDHQLLQLHYVRPGANEAWWDLAWLAAGAVLIIVGWLMTRPDRTGRDDSVDRSSGVMRSASASRPTPAAAGGTRVERRAGERRAPAARRTPASAGVERRSGADRRTLVASGQR